MKAFQLNALRNAIESLTASTYLRVEQAGIVVTLDGRCSQYISHRTVTFETADPGMGYTRISNRKYEIVIGHADEITDTIPTIYEMEKIEEHVPQELILPLLDSIHQATGMRFQPAACILLVGMSWWIPKISGFASDGTPRRVLKPEIAQWTTVVHEDETDVYLEAIIK